MLGKPHDGWTTISFNNKEFAAASYIDDVPIMVLDELLDCYLVPGHKLNLAFDNEPVEFGFVEFACEVFCVTNGQINKRTKEDLPENMFVEFSDFFGCEYEFADKIIALLAKEIIGDIEENFDDWVFWSEGPGYIDTEEEELRRDLLESKISELKDMLDKFDESNDDSDSESAYMGIEIGNLLFGNSRGEYPVERGELEEIFYQFMSKNNFDDHGYADIELHNNSFITERGGYENDTFVLNPYYWGDDEEIAEKPNFVYKPTGLEIQWYKYPFRDSYSNQEFTNEDFKEILNNCSRSIKDSCCKKGDQS